MLIGYTPSPPPSLLLPPSHRLTPCLGLAHQVRGKAEGEWGVVGLGVFH